ncbi:hypothetical protein Mapa_007319 [Marchantia paleacea]|nr:hypothetical protein Mapa_007319 [Marchantia paleacea]
MGLRQLPKLNGNDLCSQTQSRLPTLQGNVISYKQGTGSLDMSGAPTVLYKIPQPQQRRYRACNRPNIEIHTLHTGGYNRAARRARSDALTGRNMYIDTTHYSLGCSLKHNHRPILVMTNHTRAVLGQAFHDKRYSMKLPTDVSEVSHVPAQSN